MKHPSDTPFQFGSELMLRAKKPAMRHKHFPYFVLDDYVSPELFAQLEKEFPKRDQMASTYQHGKLFINNRQLDEQNETESFLAQRPAWRGVIETLGSQAFMDDLEALLRPYLLRHRMAGALRKWRAEKASFPPFDRAVQLTYEWSHMPPGAYINPHTDKSAKLATFIWYFPEPTWKPEDKGATLFLSAKRAKHNINWANYKLPFEEVDVLEQSDMQANRLTMFAKTGNSWHAVRPIECGEDTYRRVFIFNYRYPVEVANGFFARAFEAAHRRLQAPLFRDFPEVNRKPGM